MSQDDPVRLREEGSEELRSLLRAAREDLPSETALAALRARLPLEPGGGPGGGPGGSAGSAGGGLGWFLGAVGVLGGLGLAVFAWGPAVEEPEAPVAAPAALVEEPRPVEAGPAPGAADAAAAKAEVAAKDAGPVVSEGSGSIRGTEVGVQVGTAAVDVRGLPTPPVTEPAEQPDEPPKAEAAPVADLEAELRLIREAQSALAGAPGRALELAASHEEQFPEGQLAQEREVVVIQALVALGRRDEAKTRADRFRARWPGSAHVRRIDVLLGGPDAPG